MLTDDLEDEARRALSVAILRDGCKVDDAASSPWIGSGHYGEQECECDDYDVYHYYYDTCCLGLGCLQATTSSLLNTPSKASWLRILQACQTNKGSLRSKS